MPLDRDRMIRLFATAPAKRFVVFGPRHEDFAGLPMVRVEAAAPTCDWSLPQAWQNDAWRPAADEVPVFPCPAADLPEAALQAMAGWNVPRLLTDEGTCWGEINLAPASLAAHSAECARRRAEQRRLVQELAVPIVPQDGDGLIAAGSGFTNYVRLSTQAGCADDVANPQRSPLVLFEDGRPLGPAHSGHAGIAELGRGRFSHWGEYLFFASSDNSAAADNGRAYSYAMPAAAQAERLAAAFAPAAGQRAAIAPLDAALARLRAADPAGIDGRRIVLAIGTLAHGGAERQLCNLAIGLKELGWQVSVVALYPLKEDARHYVDNLACQWGLDVQSLDDALPGGPPLEALAQAAPVLARMPDEIRWMTASLAVVLRQLRPAKLVCYLDTVNVVGGFAGLLAGVPCVLLCARSLAPHHFPHIFRDWMRGLYTTLAADPRIALAANSRAGAHSYAEWLQLPAARFAVIHNGLRADSFELPSDEAAAAFRSELGIGAEAPLVAGILRFTFEKRPLFFLQIIARLRDRVPGLRAVIAGTGPMGDEVRAEVQRLGLADTVHLLGRRDDIARILRASDLLLHISSHEGFPNAVMEAQWLGRPVVCTRVGGMLEALAAPLHPFACAPDDAEGLTRSGARLLGNRPLARALGVQAREDSTLRFSSTSMVGETLSALGAGPAAGAVMPVLPKTLTPPLREALRCPACGAPLAWGEHTLDCQQGHAWPLVDGVPCLLPRPDRAGPRLNRPVSCALAALVAAARPATEERLRHETGLGPEDVRGRLVLWLGGDDIAAVDALSRWGADLVVVAGGHTAPGIQALLIERPNALVVAAEAAAGAAALPFPPQYFDVAVIENGPVTQADRLKAWAAPHLKPGHRLAVAPAPAGFGVSPQWRRLLPLLPDRLFATWCAWSIPFAARHGGKPVLGRLSGWSRPPPPQASWERR